MSGKESMISGSHKGTQIRPVSEKTAKAPLISGIIKLKHALIGYSPFDGTQSKVNRRSGRWWKSQRASAMYVRNVYVFAWERIKCKFKAERLIMEKRCFNRN